MKKLFSFLVMIVIIFFIFIYNDTIINYVLNNFVYNKEVSTLVVNDYSRDNDFIFVQHTDNFYPKNKEEIINVLYTILDSGMKEFSFFCDVDYIECKNDVTTLANDVVLLSSINNYVGPFNSYNKLFISINSLGKITVKVEKLYSELEIVEIKSFIEAVSKNTLNDKMSIRDKIKAVHDFIINNSSYDEERANSIANGNQDSSSLYDSHKATGIIRDKKAICSGYTDLMGLFLDYINVPNFKVSTEEHIWNAVFIDNKWLHLDLTWDDPITSNNENVLLHDYFLISTINLEGKKTTKHIYNKNIYAELK